MDNKCFAGNSNGIRVIQAIIKRKDNNNQMVQPIKCGESILYNDNAPHQSYYFDEPSYDKYMSAAGK